MTTATKEKAAPAGGVKLRRMHVLQLTAKNFKALREVEITPDGECMAVKGDAGQGKTSILDAIEQSLRGIDPDFVHREAGSAELELKLDAVKIKRILPREGKETLIVSDHSGGTIDNGKAFLRALCGPGIFRPIAWVELSGGEKKGQTERLRMQRAQLLEALPVELEENEIRLAVKALGSDCMAAMKQLNLDGVNFQAPPYAVCGALEKACYEFRSVLNRDVERLENQLQATPAPAKAALNEALVVLERMQADAQDRFYAAKARGNDQGKQRELAARLREEIAEIEKGLPEAKSGDIEAEVDEGLAKLHDEGAAVQERIEALEHELQSARAELDVINRRTIRGQHLKLTLRGLKAKREDLAKLEAALQEEGEAVDLAALEDALREATADVANKRQQEAHDAVAHELATIQGNAERYTRLIKLFRDEMPMMLLKKANLPIKGLSVEDEQITIGGIPLHQKGTSEQIKIGVVIAASLNPQVGFVLIDRAESLGRSDLKALGEIAREMDLQLIMTFVDADAVPSDNTVVMSGGRRV